MAKFNFKDDITAQHFEMQLVQDVKVNGMSVFDGEEANIRLKTINNQSITGRGNIDIKDEDAVVSFDTVALMKASTNLINGDYAQTLGYYAKNDGGDAQYKIRTKTNQDTIDEKFIIEISNTLIAELIIEDKTINVLSIGGGISGHFAECVNYAIAKNGYKVYIPRGDYNAEATINVNQNDTNLVCDGNITVDGISPLIKVTGYRSIIKLNGKCYGSDHVNSIFMQLGDDNLGSVSNNVYIHIANDFGTGIKCYTGNTKGVSYNNVTFDLLNINDYGILLQTSDIGVNFINENYFNGGRIACHGAVGIKTIKGANQADQYNGNVFNNICIDESVLNFVNLEYASHNIFNDMRFSEGLGNDYAIVLTDSVSNIFTSKYRLIIDKIYDNSDSDIERNYFNDGLRTSNGSFRCLNKFFTQFGKCIIEKEDAINPNLSVVSAYNTTTFTLPDSYVIGGTTVKIGYDTGSNPITFTLPKVFNKRCVNRFILLIQYKPSTASFIINDSNNNTIITIPVTTNPISKKSFMVEYTGTGDIPNVSEWKLTPLDYTFNKNNVNLCFDTVASMKASTSLINGNYARTLGYYAKNDGGGAQYKISGTLPVGEHYETLDSGLYAILILQNDIINPLQFGAIADGTTDNATLLNSLLTKYNKLNITGDFKINSSLILNDNAILIGDNKHHIILPDSSSVCVNIDGNNVLIKDLKIKTITTEYSNNTRCIRITSGLNCVIENCELYNAYNGIKIDPENNDTVGNLKIHNNNIHTIKAGIYFGNADETISFTITNVYITNNNIHDGVGVVDPSSLNNGIKLSRLTKQVVIDNNIIHDMKADGIDGFKSGDTLQITNNQIYNNGESAIELKDSTSYDDTLWGRAKNCVISNNIFYGHSYVDINLNGTPYVVTTEEYKQYQNTIIQNNIFKTGNIGIKVSTSNVTICNNIINLYDYAVQLYDSYDIDTTYKNIDIYENIINDASIRVTGTNYYAHIYNNSMKFTTDSKSPIWNASPNVIIGDNNILCEQLPYVQSSAHIIRETDRFVMVPFKFENITEQTLLKQLVIPKSNKRIQIVGAYILSNSNISSNNLSANIKFDDNVNQMYSQPDTTFTAGTKNPMRPFTSTYSAESNVDTYVNIYASTDVSGYMVLYYAYA